MYNLGNPCEGPGRPGCSAGPAASQPGAARAQITLAGHRTVPVPVLKIWGTKRPRIVGEVGVSAICEGWLFAW